MPGLIATSETDSCNEIIVNLQHVSKHFKDVVAVNNITLQIKKGTYMALLGPNGAGKTTLVEMIEGLQIPTTGEIYIMGRTWSGHKNLLHRHLGISLQETRFIDKLTVQETLRIFASFYGLKSERIEKVLQMIGLQEKRKSYTVNLSGGQRQRLALGIALLNRPSLLLLDEPTTGLDPSSRRELWHIILDLKHKYKTTMILTTHYMEEAAYLCDEIVIMDQGKILANGTLEELLSKHDKGEIIEFSVNEKLQGLNIHLDGKIREIKWDPESGKGWLLVSDIVSTIAGFMDYIHQNNLHLTSFECRKMTLEDLFISLTGRKLTDET
jgi:ABC-2 type transport system ATP-binding protein